MVAESDSRIFPVDRSSWVFVKGRAPTAMTSWALRVAPWTAPETSDTAAEPGSGPVFTITALGLIVVPLSAFYIMMKAILPR